jgi:tetratricopeptide (TPR) repeat protein
MQDVRLRQWLDAGLAAHRQGDVARALEAYRAALAVSPGDPDALNLLGTGLLQLGETADAVTYLEQAARRQRGNPRLLANLAQAYIACQRHAEAADAFRKAARIAPQELHFQLGLAVALAMQGKLGEATPLLKRLAARHPDAPAVWFNLGNALRDGAQHAEAIAAYTRAIALDGAYADAINSLGSAYQSTLRFAEAEEQYRKVLAIAPEHLSALYNLGSVVTDLGRFREAEAVCRRLVACAPDWATAHTILGAAFGHQGRLLEARACHARAIELAPDDVKAAETYAGTLMETGRPAQGLRWFSHALRLTGYSDALQQLLGTELLSQVLLQDGWTYYRRRPAALRFREKYPHLSLASALPRELAGKHVCVLREQGLGDEIFFLRYAERLAERGARVTYRASNKIASILGRARFISTLVEEMSPLPPADANILVGDLPHALGALEASVLERPAAATSGALPDFPVWTSIFWPSVPRSIALEPLADLVEEMGERRAALGPPPYIALTWRAGTAPEEQSSATWALYKSIPLEALAAALRHSGGTFVALQRNPRASELETLSTALGRPLHDLTALNEDLERMLALLSLIDDYVTLSNTNVHLRAALGRPARVLVPVPAEWRWRQSGSGSQWFPGFPVYRQSLQGDWGPALAALRRDLELSYPRAPRA